jgi:hypothetical protein
MITQGDGAGQGGTTMLATVNDVRHAYPHLQVAEVPMDLWVAYHASRRLLLFSDHLGPQEAQAVAAAQAHLSAAGIHGVPSPRRPAEERG